MTWTFVRAVRYTWAAFLAACAVLSAHAQPAGYEMLYLYRGADRDERLLENARREGVLVIYTSLAPSESVPLTQAFEKKHGIRVELWRAASEKVTAAHDQRSAG
jgi:iron(III) transport system substrate-binding protein